MPNYQTSVNTTTVTRQGTLEKINQITKIDNELKNLNKDRTLIYDKKNKRKCNKTAFG